MIIAKKKLNSKFFMFLLQAIVMFFVFLLLVDKQTVCLIRDLIQNLNIDSNIQSLIARMYVGFKVMFDLPSFIGIFIIILQIVCATWTFKFLFMVFPKKFFVEVEKIIIRTKKICVHTKTKRYSYLINQRLLN